MNIYNYSVSKPGKRAKMAARPSRVRQSPGYYVRLSEGNFDYISGEDDGDDISTGSPDVFEVEQLVSSRKSRDSTHVGHVHTNSEV